MAQYINKDLLLKAIKARRNRLVALMHQIPYASNYPVWSSNVDLLDEIKKAIDTLEVKEVDLEKEIDKIDDAIPGKREDIEYIAKHFFELGIKAQKGE